MSQRARGGVGSAERAPAKIGPALVTEAALREWGRAIGARVRPPLWISLYGELGAGKSVLARAVCEGAGVAGWVPSPSFVLMHPYRSPRGFSVIHVDLYRIEREEELDGLGWNDLLAADAVVLVEWADRTGGLLPEDRWEVTLEHVGDPERRRIRAEAVGGPAPLPALAEEAAGR